jgi:hypothetical protein
MRNMALSDCGFGASRVPETLTKAWEPDGLGPLSDTKAHCPAQPSVMARWIRDCFGALLLGSKSI